MDILNKYYFFRRKNVFYFLLSAASAICAEAQLSIEDYESGNGFLSGNSIDIYSNWNIYNGAAWVDTAAAASGTQSVSISPQSDIEKALSFSGGTNVSFTQFNLSPAAGDSSVIDLDGAVIGFDQDGSRGRFWVLDGDGSGGSGVDYSVGPAFSLDANGRTLDFVSIAIRQDFANDVWDLIIDGTIVASDLGFQDDIGSLTGPASLLLGGHSSEPIYLDDLSMGNVNLAFADSNGNAIEDSWELGNGYALNPDSRYSDSDADTFTAIEEYLNNTDPHEVDVCIGETGRLTVDQPSSTFWYSVQLKHSYSNPVVVMSMNSNNDTAPQTIRVKNVTGTSFEFQIDEWDYLDGIHGEEVVSYLVVEAGVHHLKDGRILQADTVFRNNGYGTYFYPHPYLSSPTLLSQAMTVNDPASGNTRQRHIGQANFQIRYQGQESAQSHGYETLGWVAVSRFGLGDYNLMNQVANSPDNVAHSWKSFNFAQPFGDVPVLLGKQQRADGGDPANIRFRDITNSGFQTRIEEEHSHDSETGHTSESIGYWALEFGNLYSHKDSDGDGLPDYFEINYGLDPNDATGVNSASGNPDGDSYDNWDELIRGRVPTFYDDGVAGADFIFVNSVWGNDSFDGKASMSLSNGSGPKHSVQAGVSACGDGDTIFIYPGNDAYSVTSISPGSGNRLTIKPFGQVILK